MYIVHICFDKAVNKAATEPIRCFYTGVPFFLYLDLELDWS